ncbi:MAG: DUF1453 family protein [Alphaproteobacteria bacterium]|nr:DUF1453 family protein [Alphaproteobacteria bacterium]
MLKQIAPYIGPLIILAVLAWRSSRAMKGRAVKPWQLWIRPALISLFMAVALASAPLPNLFGLALYVVAAAAGLGLGYLLARHQELTLDPVSHKIISKTSPIGVILFIALFAARYAFKMMVSGGRAPDKLMAHSGQIALYTDVGLLFLLALVSAQAWEIWRRTRPLVAEKAARLAKMASE